MKKLLLPISLVLAHGAFAALTVTDPFTFRDGTVSGTNETTNTTNISGSGSWVPAGVTTYKSLYLEGTAINFDDSTKSIKLTTAGNTTQKTADGGLSVSAGAAYYAMVITNSTLSFSNGAGMDFGSASNSISAYKKTNADNSAANKNTSSSIIVAADAGTIKLQKIFSNYGKIILTLHKENAFTHKTANSSVLIGGVQKDGISMELNMSKDQRFSWDIRDQSRVVINITNSAVLSVDSFNVNTDGYTGMFIIEDSLANGAMLFDADINAIWNQAGRTLTVTTGTSTTKTQIFTFYSAYTSGTNKTLADIIKVDLGDGSFKLVNSAYIPEPAEWAAIFGAIALGLAIYRRRRK